MAKRQHGLGSEGDKAMGDLADRLSYGLRGEGDTSEADFRNCLYEDDL